MNTLSVLAERFAGTVLFNGTVTGTGDAKGILPDGSNAINIACLVTMANAADLTLSIVTADDADGTTPVAITENIPIWKNGTKQTDAKTLALTDADSSNWIVFCIPPILIPAGKYICVSFANSNDANILSAVALDDTIYN